jgi:hypothetical protein
MNLPAEILFRAHEIFGNALACISTSEVYRHWADLLAKGHIVCVHKREKELGHDFTIREIEKLSDDA